MAMMGMGFQSVVTVPVNENAQMDVDALEKTMAHLQAEGKVVACVVATAGTTDAGAIDPLKKIREITTNMVHGCTSMLRVGRCTDLVK